MHEGEFSGGCQCGAIRFHGTKLGRPSICHCRMCQKATGNFFAPLVTVYPGDFQWTRGTPHWFSSSAQIRRGFCHKCGTPLAYEHPNGLEITIGAFDHPAAIEPQVQVNHDRALPWIDNLFDKPMVRQGLDESNVVSYQHPDHETAHWPPEVFAHD